MGTVDTRLRNEKQEVLLLSASQAASLCGVSVRQWWRLDSMGKVPTHIRIGNTKRWRRIELQKWINAGCPSREEWEASRNFGVATTEKLC